MIDVLIATKGDRAPLGLPNIPGPYNVFAATDRPWAVAANRLLDGAAQTGNDALFVDDDIELTPETFMAFHDYKDAADVIGFTLINPTPGGNQYQSGPVFMPRVWIETPDGSLILQHPTAFDTILTPCYVAHVTASCMYLSSRLIQAGVRFPVWPGQHHEDVAFTLDAWLRGFRVMYLPGRVIHHMAAPGNVGATKAMDPKFNEDRQLNAAYLARWVKDNRVRQACEDGRIPVGLVPVERGAIH